jgi:hypothetical protein
MSSDEPAYGLTMGRAEARLGRPGFTEGAAELMLRSGAGPEYCGLIVYLTPKSKRFPRFLCGRQAPPEKGLP